MKSKLFWVNAKDVVRSLLLAVLTAAGTTLLQIVNTGLLPDRAGWKTVGISAGAAGLSYIIKNFLTNSNDQFLKKEIGDAPSS